MGSATSNRRKVVIVGLDGATFDLIDPWAKEGRLPTLKRLMEEGSRGALRSTFPPLTYPAWSTFMTGRNPGKHGIFDFTERIPGENRIRFVNASFRRSDSFWRLLSREGRRVCSISLPVTYPPEPINGVMISGFDAPGVGSKADGRSVHPGGLLEELREAVGDYIIASDIGPLMKNGLIGESIKRIHETIDRKAATALYLLKKEPWDCFMMLFGETDLGAHYFWKYADEASPLYTRMGDERLSRALFDIYRKMDDNLARIMEEAPKEAVLMVMSDHGFGGASTRIFHLNRWLAEKGFLRFDSRAFTIKKRLLEGAKSLGLKFLPPSVKREMMRSLKGVADSIESSIRFSGVDWGDTRVYSEESPHYPSLWVNLEGREPEGIVTPGAEYERIRREVRDALLDWKDPETGAGLVSDVYFREEIYKGPYVSLAPDILFETACPGGYSYQSRSSQKGRGSKVCYSVDPKDPDSIDFFLNRSGSHRRNGIFIVAGEGIRKVLELEGLGIEDCAPTILYLNGVETPTDMDGRVIDEIFE